MKRAGVLILVAACQTANLPRLPVQMTPAQRVTIFQQWHGTIETDAVSGQQETVSITFANGNSTSDPEDLLPVLPPDSEAVRHIRASSGLRKRSVAWWAGGVVGFAVGLIVGFNLVGRDRQGDQDWSTAKYPIIAGLGALIVGSAVFYFYRQRAFDEASRAYNTYNADLATRLQVCVDGLAVRACDALVR